MVSNSYTDLLNCEKKLVECFGGDKVYHMKVLVPSVTVGAIIDKGGQTISDIRDDSTSRVVLSSDLYPGTNERVTLILGTVDEIMSVLDFISDNIPISIRNEQVKILIADSSVCMIIGSGGKYIKLIKNISGCGVELSENLVTREWCITVTGDKRCNKTACNMILEKLSSEFERHFSGCDKVSSVDSFETVESRVADFTCLNIKLKLMSSTSPVILSVLDTIKMALRDTGFSRSSCEDIDVALKLLAKYGDLQVALGSSLMPYESQGASEEIIEISSTGSFSPISSESFDMA